MITKRGSCRQRRSLRIVANANRVVKSNNNNNKENNINRLCLNDEIINEYMDLINLRSPNTVYAFNTFFFWTLSNKGYPSICRWTKNVDIFSKEKLIIPIHIEEMSHWCLVCVDFKEKTIKYYDSLGERNFKCLKFILFYLFMEHLHKKDTEFHAGGWLLQNVPDCPQQENDWDCGVFICIYAEYLTRGAPFDFSQKDMKRFRKQIRAEIKKKQLWKPVLIN